MTEDISHRAFLKRYAWLSIATAVVAMALKVIAYWLTGSVGLLSDAMESIVNLIGALMALATLTVAAWPADEEHTYGYSKAEYFSSGAEGTFILVAALSIAVAAIERFMVPKPLEQLNVGLAIYALSSLVNLSAAIVILRASRRYHSITLEAHSRHLLTDVWTSGGVLIGVGAVALTGWETLDPVVALLVAANIVRFGVGIVRRSVLGLLDTALPADEQERLHTVLERYRSSGIEFHALRSRQAGARRFLSLHVLVPGRWTVHEGHQLLERIESDIRGIAPNVTVFTHLESADDPASWDDVTLDRRPDAGRK